MTEEHLRAELDRFKADNARLVTEKNALSDEVVELRHTIRVLEREIAEVKEDEIRAEIEEALRARSVRQTS